MSALYMHAAPWEDPKNGLTLGFYNLHYRSTRVKNWGFHLLDPRRALGNEYTWTIWCPTCTGRIQNRGKKGRGRRKYLDFQGAPKNGRKTSFWFRDEGHKFLGTSEFRLAVLQCRPQPTARAHPDAREGTTSRTPSSGLPYSCSPNYKTLSGSTFWIR